MDKLKIIASGYVGGSFNWYTGEVEGITYDDIQNQIKDFKGSEIEMVITSNGGSADEANTIHDLLVMHPSSITTTILGTAKSAGTKLAMSADKGKRRMTSSSIYMIHNVQGGVVGSIRDIENTLNAYTVYNNGLIDSYVEATGLDRDTIIEMMDNDTYMDAKTALELGFIDEIINDVPMSNYSGVENHTIGTNPKITPINKLPIEVQNKLTNSSDNNSIKNSEMKAFEGVLNSINENLSALKNSVLGVTASKDDDGKVVVSGLESLTTSIDNMQTEFAKGIESIQNSFEEIQTKMEGFKIENFATKEELKNLPDHSTTIENFNTGIKNISAEIAKLSGKAEEFKASSTDIPNVPATTEEVVENRNTVTTSQF